MQRSTTECYVKRCATCYFRAAFYAQVGCIGDGNRISIGDVRTAHARLFNPCLYGCRVRCTSNRCGQSASGLCRAIVDLIVQRSICSRYGHDSTSCDCTSIWRHCRSGWSISGVCVGDMRAASSCVHTPSLDNHRCLINCNSYSTS